MRKIFSLSIVLGLPILFSYLDMVLCKFSLGRCETGPEYAFISVVATLYVIVVGYVFRLSLVFEKVAARTFAAFSTSLIIAALCAQLMFRQNLDKSIAPLIFIIFAYIAVPVILGILVWPNEQFNKD